MGGRSGSSYGGYGGYGGYEEEEEYYEESGGGMGSQVVHLRGLPFKCTDDDISNVSRNVFA